MEVGFFLFCFVLLAIMAIWICKSTEETKRTLVQHTNCGFIPHCSEGCYRGGKSSNPNDLIQVLNNVRERMSLVGLCSWGLLRWRNSCPLWLWSEKKDLNIPMCFHLPHSFFKAGQSYLVIITIKCHRGIPWGMNMTVVPLAMNWRTPSNRAGFGLKHDWEGSRILECNRWRCRLLFHVLISLLRKRRMNTVW